MQSTPSAAATMWIATRSSLSALSCHNGYQVMMNTGDKEFIVYKSFSEGGRVYLMSGLSKSNPDYNDLLSIACFFAKKGKTVHVLSPIHYKDPGYHTVFGALIGTMYYRKCPDLLIDGEFYEYESYERPFEMEKIERMISRGAKQASDIVIDIRGSSTTKKVVNNKILKLKGQKSFSYVIDSVWIYDGEKVEQVYKNRGASPSISAEKSLRLTNP